MGFGSYDETEQGKNEVGVDEDDDDGSVSKKGEYDGEAEFDFGDADTEDLVGKLDEIKEDED